MKTEWKAVLAVSSILGSFFGVIAYAHQIAPLDGKWNVVAQQTERPAQSYFDNKVATSYMVTGFQGNYRLAPADHSHAPIALQLCSDKTTYVGMVNQSLNEKDGDGNTIKHMVSIFELSLAPGGNEWTGRMTEKVDFANGQAKAACYDLDAKRAPKA